MALLDELIASVVAETRFKDASYYPWRIRDGMLGSIKASSPENVTTDDQKTLASAMSHEVDGKIYYAYSLIFAYTDEPFTTLQPETLFHASRSLLNVLGKEKPPPGISIARIAFTLAQHAQQLEAFKLAHMMYERLQTMRVRPEWQRMINLTNMVIQAKPYSDWDDLLPIEYRSSTTNPLLHPTSVGDVCVNSAHPFVRSFLSFDNVPLVEFAPTPDLSDDEAMALIETLPSMQHGKHGNNNDKWKTS
ncbi:hypothetical protein SPRG_16550 [Saprolegnia parasitica CBS 223.65]|uniref:IFT122 zinc ribbon domain-containing protein n=1 Tax=Saprolegnia parasitica (strain CBS 223.65) TaxID=695850 RepID=A0A067BIN1_SAPPC|nr:hypothetical protein SPRG_16550 [Saprolegnia parasitica CBS 223.65]KDO18038.1 hypothetical protein SPRG_16550 [Saprolegnia parasitica CBS 223.65]|eukprot:XP_012211255.1 hypothetical protein SPRG_16550 [Saprolegnia parasitica CBS 223.65]